ncbi:hypothetical protein BD410DRAFT_780689 [Rickenella mellea]|uniref:F-box domain-containing protein n=1 Tax=Rickenella mellea TaxID=50990 RepID=A0A4R5XG54_9AGAM|nr:hypothetical protein BD410DRAFT_780689 [Rickenella mellea]
MFHKVALTKKPVARGSTQRNPPAKLSSDEPQIHCKTRALLNKLTGQVCGRWESFEFDNHSQLSLSICQKLSELHFERLSSLTLKCCSETATKLEDVGSIANFWTIECLRHLSIRNATFHHKWEIGYVLHGLGAMPSLQSLTLHFHGFTGFSGVCEPEMDPLPMTNLRTLTYIFGYCNPKSIITPFIGRILFPGLTSLNIEFRWRCGDIRLDWLLKGSDPYPYLRSLHLKIHDCVVNTCDLSMARKAMPSLKHISLDGLFNDIYPGPSDSAHSWETLRVERHENMSGNIAFIAKELVDAPSFQRWDIIQHRSIFHGNVWKI